MNIINFYRKIIILNSWHFGLLFLGRQILHEWYWAYWQQPKSSHHLLYEVWCKRDDEILYKGCWKLCYNNRSWTIWNFRNCFRQKHAARSEERRVGKECRSRWCLEQ